MSLSLSSDLASFMKGIMVELLRMGSSLTDNVLLWATEFGCFQFMSAQEATECKRELSDFFTAMYRLVLGGFHRRVYVPLTSNLGLPMKRCLLRWY